MFGKSIRMKRFNKLHVSLALPLSYLAGGLLLLLPAAVGSGAAGFRVLGWLLAGAAFL